ncbi:hypothetical protein VM1G_06908 [Cytospora mali]|uniref:Uncharacterized protein n=1 Tax=Cytospora mali TaxID=578113 RepID=A0A194W5K8_CYTMA|nr:hypothetical protein VM1G_06908 [Valsa mali]
MTNQIYGSSLFQARKTDHVHRHAQLHDRKINRHLRSHAEFHRRHEDSEPAPLEPRDSTITEIVQTISVVQVIDGSGSTVEVQTVSATPQTNLIDGDTGSTIKTNYKAMSLTSSFDNCFLHDRDYHIFRGSRITNTYRGYLNNGSPDEYLLNLNSCRNLWTLHLTYIRSLIISIFIFIIVFFFFFFFFIYYYYFFFFVLKLPFLELRFQFHHFTVTTNTWVASSTLLQTSLSSLVTTLSSSATSSGSAISSTPDSISSSAFSSSSSASTYQSSSGSSSFSNSASATYGAGGSDGSGATSVYATPSSSSASTTSGSSSNGSAASTPTPTGTVVGGVVGGVAGLALLIAFAFLLLRMKKNGWHHTRPGNVGSAPAAGAIGPPPDPSGTPGPSTGEGGGNGDYGTMQRPAPYSVAASLAALAGKRASRDRAGSGPEMAERGFVRVSGKKLPPVLQFGGDGFTDPRDRDSVTSDASVYRDSMAVFNQPSHQRLALGSPMRPESGLLIMNPGPAKTPVTSLVTNPLDTPSLPRSSTYPPSPDALGSTLAEGAYSHEASSSRDAVGRTLAAQDYSRDGAASRTSRQSRQSGKFTEHVQ